MKKYARIFLAVLVGLFLTGLKRGRAKSKGGKRMGQSRRKGYVQAGEAVDGPEDLTQKGWKAVMKRTMQGIKEKNLLLMAAALGYYATLTFFPAILGLASLYTTIVGPEGLQTLLSNLHQVVPATINSLIQTELSPLTHATRGSLGTATIISLALVLWTTSGGVSNLIKATNVSYDVEEERNFVKLRLMGVVMSLVFIGFSVIVAVLLVLNSHSLSQFGVPMPLARWFPWVRWIVLVVAVSLLLSLIYRYAPNRREPRWSWVSWGATAATILWLIVTAIFFFYVQNFGNYNHSYGSFASIVVLMIWFNLTSLIVLVGAEVNKNIEDVGGRNS